MTYLYMLKCITLVKKRTYVGYTKQRKKRLKNTIHQRCKYTRGKNGKLYLKNSHQNQKQCLKEELKHDRKKEIK